MKYLLEILVLIIATAGFGERPALAASSCRLSMNTPNISLIWNQNFNFQAVTFTVSKAKNAACNYAVSFSKGGGADYSNRRMTYSSSSLNYQLYQDSALTMVLKDAQDVTSANDYITGSFPTGNNLSQTVTFYVQIPQSTATTPTYKMSGTYADTFTMKLFENPVSTSDTPVSTAGVNITAAVPKIIDVSLGSVGGAFDPAQTTLTQGQSLSLGLMVRTNAGFAITFSSQNNGELAHTSSSITTRVPYSLTVNAVARNLSSSQATPVTVATGSGQTSTSGVTHPVAITIGSTAGTMSGQYSDNITVTAATTE
jgi:hypothetical protein